MLDLIIKSEEICELFSTTALGRHINVGQRLNIEANALRQYELVVNKLSYHFGDAKENGKCISEILQLGGFDELLLDSCGGYAKIVKVKRKGLPTYFIRPPCFKLGEDRKIGGEDRKRHTRKKFPDATLNISPKYRAVYTKYSDPDADSLSETSSDDYEEAVAVETVSQRHDKKSGKSTGAGPKIAIAGTITAVLVVGAIAYAASQKNSRK